ncbi:MAG TPA: hypothetical protein VE961_05670 [Pyrinomonadaceae bacterium]|nr:hypothetical protein [Pyrinomonadaceae bacterium]
MNSDSTSTVKLLLVVIVVAVLAAVVATLAQYFIAGKSNAGVTGGVAGALSAGVAVTVWKKKSASN